VDLLDVVILIAAVAYAVGGYRNGAVVGLFSLAGFLGGAVAGAQLGRPLGSAIAHGQGQVVVALLTVLVVALLGQLAMVFVARLLRSHITWRSAQAVDSGIGALLGVVSVLLVAWMVAVPLASSPYPTLASQARHSSIVSKVDDAVPGDLRQVYSSLRNYIDRSGFPQVFNDLQPTHITDVNPPDAALLNAPGVVADKASVLKIYGTADSCSRAIEGSGFVYAPGLVVTNAHVVAGTDRVTVQVSPLENLSAQVVVYDPETDVAVLRVAGLKATPLKFAPKAAVSGDNAIVLGYPENGPFTADAARIRDQQQIVGPDIYNQQQVKRQIYAIRGTVRSGNSGGPLIAPDGTVLGIVFATALDSSNTGFVLTYSQISDDVTKGLTATGKVSTQGCAD
jgi:S1-C subfamily serine protease